MAEYLYLTYLKWYLKFKENNNNNSNSNAICSCDIFKKSQQAWIANELAKVRTDEVDLSLIQANNRSITYEFEWPMGCEFGQMYKYSPTSIPFIRTGHCVL